MSGLEAAAQPFLTPLIQGEETNLFPKAHRVLATWCVKTALMFRFSESDAYIPEAHYSAMFQRKRPSDNTAVWLSGYKSGRLLHYEHRQLTVFQSDTGALQPPTHDSNAYCATFHIKHALFQVLGLFGPHALAIKDDPLVDRSLIALWPSYGKLERWPPQEVFDEETEGGLGLRFG